MWDEIQLLEECEPSDAEGILSKIRRKALDLAHDGNPSYLYTIYFLDCGVRKRWQAVADGWYWKERHKIFYVQVGENKVEVSSFYCDKENFISQDSRLCNM
jgi:hypothetical protein